MKNPFKSHPSSTPLIVQAHDPARTRGVRIALVAAWVLSIAAVWAIASYRAAPGLFEMQGKLLQAESQRESMRAELEEIKQKLSISERSDQVSRSANEVLQEQLTTSEEEIASLRADLAFYQRLMGGKAPRQGLTVQQIALRPIGDGDGYENCARPSPRTCARAKPPAATPTSAIEGMLKGSLKALDWNELVQRKPEQPPSFSFKYFQELDASFVLPEGFAQPRRARDEIRTRRPIRTQFPLGTGARHRSRRACLEVARTTATGRP